MGESVLTEKSGGADNPVTSRKVLLSCPFSQYRSSGGSPARAKPVNIPTVPLPFTPGQVSSSSPNISGRAFTPEPTSEQYLLEKRACREASSSMSISLTDSADCEEDFLQSEKGFHHLNFDSITNPDLVIVVTWTGFYICRCELRLDIRHPHQADTHWLCQKASEETKISASSTSPVISRCSGPSLHSDRCKQTQT